MLARADLRERPDAKPGPRRRKPAEAPTRMNRRQWRSLHLRARALDDAGPFLRISCDEGLELLRRHAQRRRAEIGHTRADAGIIEPGIDLAIEPRDDLGRQALRS